MTLAYEDAKSKLLDVASAPFVDGEECVDDSLVVNFKLEFGIDLNFGQSIKAEVWSRF